MSSPASRMSSLPSAVYVDDPGFPGSSGADNPPSADKPQEVYDWCLQMVADGEGLNRRDPSYDIAEKLIDDVEGEQDTGRHISERHRVVVNQTKKAINTHASMLTDLKSLWEWRTQNPRFKNHAAIMNDLLLTWWIQTSADMELADAVRYAETIGSSDLLFEFDPRFSGGDMRLTARDWRDTLPIRPSRSRTVQDWGGLVLRDNYTPAHVRALYPGRLKNASTIRGRFSSAFTGMRRLITPRGEASSTLSGLGAKDPNQRYSAVAAQPQVTLYQLYVRDYSINLTDKPVLVGPPARNWAYWVKPGGRLYPRGRCVVFVDGDPDRRPLFDGPNPYWHGQWPLTRLSLQRWPWRFVGMPLTNDLRALQKVMNGTINDFLQVFSQWVNRGSVWGKNVPEAVKQRFDPAKPNWKVTMSSLVGSGFQLQDGPQLPPWAFQFLMFMFQKWDDLSGVANLQQLLSLRQMPNEKTIEKFFEAMTPEIRLEARQIECFLREIAGMFLPNVAQFYSVSKRMLKLGDDGRVLEDVDYDPDTVIPALSVGDPNYTPELDKSLPRDARAMWYIKQFAFWVAPGSILALHAMERQMMYLQLSRQGYVDFWTLGEMLEIPNLGTPPPVLLPKMTLNPEDMANAEVDPATGQPQVEQEWRVPRTVTERLMAQYQLGIGQTNNPAGRKASGQEAPQVEQNSDGSQKVSESG